MKKLAVCLIVIIIASCQSNKPIDNLLPPVSTVTLAQDTAPKTQVGDERDATTITFACPKPYREAIETLAAEFHTVNPAIEVEVVAVEDLPEFDWSSDLLSPESTYAIVSRADTAMWLVSPPAAQSGLYRDLSSFIDTDATFAPDDFFPHTLEAFKWDGRTYALPTRVILTVIYYDKRMFDEVGLAYPALEWTFDDFIEAAQHLTVRVDGEISRYGFADLASIGNDSFISSRVGEIVDETGRPAFGSTALTEAVQWYADLMLEHAAMPNFENASFNMSDLVRLGGVAMWSDSPGKYDDYSAASDLGVAPLPVSSQAGDSRYPGKMYGYLMSAGTAYPQESWRWLHFLTRRSIPGQCLDCLPVRRSVTESTLYWARFNHDIIPTIQFMAEHLYFPHSPAMFQYVQLATSQVFDGAPVGEALHEAQQAALDAYERVAQATPWAVTVSSSQNNTVAETPQVLFAAPVGSTVSLHELATEFNTGREDFKIAVVPPSDQPSADCFGGMRSVSFEEVRTELLNLQPLLEADVAFSSDDFSPEFLEAYRYQGALWGIPLQAQVRVLYYRRDHFDALGLDYPQPDWTTAEFMNAALVLRQAGWYGYLPLDGEASDLVTWLALLGGDPWDGQGHPRFDTPEVVAAVRWYSDLVQRYEVMPALLSSDMEDREARLALVRKGKVGMWSDFTGAPLNRDLGLDDTSVGVAPLPVGAQAASYFLHEGMFIANDSAYSSRCWAWMKFVSERYTPVKGIPARNSILASPDFANQVGEEAQNVYTTMLDYIDTRARYHSATWAGQAPYLLEALTEILGGASPESALAAAQHLATQKESDN